jgi:multidrug efflux pump subunit AcrA (membrane-fusion protein)
MTKQLRAAVAAMLVLSTVSMQAQAATPPRSSKKVVKKKAETPLERTLRELREQMQAQQAQIDELRRQLADRDTRLSTATQDAQAANASAAAAATQAQSALTAIQSNHEEMQTLSSSVSDLKVANTGLAQTISDTKRDITSSIESPTTIRYKGVTITPVAFFAFETIWRQRALNADVNTPFNTTPYMGGGEAHTSELNFSGRQSRVGGLFEGNTGPFKLAGYVEADFLSAGATSNENQSNSYTLRQRQIWGQLATQKGFTVTGGQMWSLVTETKKSTDNRTENLPMTVDAQYHVGFSWARQAAIRFQQRVGTGFTVAASLEEGQTLYSATNANQNFFIGNAGSGGGLYNVTANYSNDVSPDLIVKGTYDGKAGHYEIGGVGRALRSPNYPRQTNLVPTAAGGPNHNKQGGGLLAHARFPVKTYVDFGLHVMGGTGVGRYGTSTLPDVTVHPDGTLAPIKSWQGLYSMEFHPAPKWDVYGYAGAEYAQRTVYLSTLGSSAGKLIGYAPQTSLNTGCNTETLPTSTGNGLAGGPPYNPGTPANCLGATRVVIEGTAGFTYRFYNSPKYGRLQYQGVYSYLVRNAWTGVGGAPSANNNMVFTGMRYYIP